MTTALVFPGQGSHRPGMAAAWDEHPRARATFDEVGRAAGLDLARLADDPEACRATAVAQPAVFAASLAAWRALTDAGIGSVAAVAGHSLGEIAAAVAAGALTVQDGARVVAERGAAMGEACQASPGTMAAVLGLDDDAVVALRAQLGGAVLANDNAPGQIVLSGPPEAVERACAAARDLGGKVRPLEVEGAFHSPAMSPAAVRLAAALDRVDLGDPVVPLVTGTTGEVADTGEAVDRALRDGILSTVKWRAVQERLAALGTDTLVEVGPGGVLKGLARRGLPAATTFVVDRPDRVAGVLDHLTSGASNDLVTTGGGSS